MCSSDLVVGGLMLSAGWGPAAVVPVAVLLGMGMGAFQGALVAGLGLPSIVVTLAAMVTLREGLRWLQQGVFVNLPDGVQWFGLALLELLVPLQDVPLVVI